MAGQRPEEIASQNIEREIVIMGVIPSDFMTEHAPATFDLSDFQIKFKKICRDYGKPLIWVTPFKALQFCSKVLYKIGPESRKVKKSTGDKTWVLKFPYKLIKS